MVKIELTYLQALELETMLELKLGNKARDIADMVVDNKDPEYRAILEKDYKSLRDIYTAVSTPRSY